jgi:hypothetical protein
MGVNTDASKCAKDGGFLALPYNKSRYVKIFFLADLLSEASFPLVHITLHYKPR